MGSQWLPLTTMMYCQMWHIQSLWSSPTLQCMPLLSASNSLPPVFDHLSYVNAEGDSLGNLVMYGGDQFTYHRQMTSSKMSRPFVLCNYYGRYHRYYVYPRFHLTSPDITWHHLISCDLTWYHVTSPDIMWLHLTSPDITWLHLTSPDIMWHHLTSCDLTWSWCNQMWPDLLVASFLGQL